LKVSKKLPHINFVIVGPKKNTLGENYPKNIKYFYNISYTKFQRLMMNCSVIALPINTEAPAGLIVLFTTGLMSKPVVTTNNITMREYILNNKNGILISKGDDIEFSNKLNNLFLDHELQKEFGESLYNRIDELGSPQKFVEKIIQIVEIIKHEDTTN